MPLLMVPGTLCDHRLWDQMIGQLGPYARALPPIEQPSVGEAAEAVLDDAPERFVAAGFSLGAFVVLELLRRAPDRLAGVVLIAGNAGVLPDDQAGARRAEVELARAASPDAVVEQLWPRYVAAARTGDAELRRCVGSMADAVGAERFAAQAEIAISRPDSHETVRRTAVPVLTICGEEDAICPPARCAAVQGPTVSQRSLPGVGHFVPLEAPVPAAGELRAWMQETTPCC